MMEKQRKNKQTKNNKQNLIYQRKINTLQRHERWPQNLLRKFNILLCTFSSNIESSFKSELVSCLFSFPLGTPSRVQQQSQYLFLHCWTLAFPFPTRIWRFEDASNACSKRDRSIISREREFYWLQISFATTVSKYYKQRFQI